MNDADEILRLKNEIATLRSVCIDLLEANVTVLGVAASATAGDESETKEYFSQFRKIRSEIYDKLGMVHG